MSSLLKAGEALNSVDRQIGSALRGLRIDRGLSQAELARRIGRDAHDIERYEAGLERIDARRLIDLAQALGAPARAFWGGVRRGGD